MIKYLILFIHLIGFSFYQLIFGDVSVTQNLPKSFNAGEEVVVDVTIKKDNVAGFAKVQQELPEGFFAEVIESKGATFSFKNNIVKFIWMALPSENEFKISYKLKTTESIEGDFSLAGKFSFIDENERKNIEIPASSITILKVKEEVAETIEEKTNADESSENAIENVVDEVVVTEATVSEPIEETVAPVKEVVEEESNKVEINISRDIIATEESFNVSLAITQSNLQGFAKIVESIPAGFNAEVVDAKGGVFSYKDSEAKILWMAAPTDEKFTVIYKLIPVDAPTANYTVKGSFSYLENDITQKYVFNPSEFNYTQPSAPENIAKAIEETPETVVENTVEEKPIEEPVVEENEEVVVEQIDEKETITSIPSPETGITYKVQVGAGHQKVSNNYFSKKFNLNETVATEAHEGWIKYLVGSFSDYKSARDKRNEIRKNVKRAFVTAYNQGTRITVQEALMISNQKWYK